MALMDGTLWTTNGEEGRSKMMGKDRVVTGIMNATSHKEKKGKPGRKNGKEKHRNEEKPQEIDEFEILRSKRRNQKMISNSFRAKNATDRKENGSPINL